MRRRIVVEVAETDMCTTITMPGGLVLRSVMEVRAVGMRMPGDSMVDQEMVWPDFGCLCGVDLEDLMLRNGMSFVKDTSTGNVVALGWVGD